MKRLTYISKFARPLSTVDIENIGIVSHKNNKIANVTGILLCSSGIFFQVLEGDAVQVDQKYEKIKLDDRHTEVLCLKNEENISERMFPDWSMKIINLDENVDALVQPIKTLLSTITESYLILEKYTQPTIFKIINSGINPLEVPPRSVEKVILFADIFGFSTLAEKIPIQEVIALVNQFFTISTNIITARGGEVSKFIGDCVMAYFTADKTDDAVQASIDILTAIDDVRNTADPNSFLKILYTGIGISQGIVIEGNIGSSVKKDYTILGDAVNVASRLESLTRQFPWYLIFSEDVKQNLNQSWNFVELGTSYPKGKKKPIKIYSINQPIVKKKSDFDIQEYITNHLEEDLRNDAIRRVGNSI